MVSLRVKCGAGLLWLWACAWLSAVSAVVWCVVGLRVVVGLCVVVCRVWRRLLCLASSAVSAVGVVCCEPACSLPWLSAVVVPCQVTRRIL